MEKTAFLIEGKDYGKLKALVAADPYQKDSFAIIGYSLKESKSLGLKGGNYVLYFKSADTEIVNKLKEKVKTLETAKEMDGAEKDAVISTIERDEENAAAGVGSIFG